jgi:DeoR/GlpR family transcriptional regulator of sugar metabolism
MIIEEREAVIVSLLEQRGLISLQAISDAMPGVSSVTLRRDLARLSSRGGYAGLMEVRRASIRATFALIGRC